MQTIKRLLGILVGVGVLLGLAACGGEEAAPAAPEVRVIEEASSATPSLQARITDTPTPTPLPSRTPQPTPRQVTVSRISADIDPRQVTPIAPGAQLPALALTDIDGQTIDLSALGRPLVLNFWTVGCGSCFYEFPVLQDFYAHHGADNLAIIGVNVAEFPEVTRRFAQQMGATFPQVVDAQAEFFATYFNGAVVPTTIFVDAEGRISQVMTGPMDAYNIDLQLQALGLPAREDIPAG